MLTHLQIKNFIIIENLELDFNKGLSVITGETGAGKSIIIDALSLLMGARADINYIGAFQDKCDLSACFSLEGIRNAIDWLSENEYGEAPWTECIVRRVLHKDGKSRQTINGSSCTTQQLKEFVSLFLNIHSQNQQQLLTKRSHQRVLLDGYARHFSLIDEVKDCYQSWLENQKQIQQLLSLGSNSEVQSDLLRYQIEEFEKVALQPGEYELLDKEHKQLANAGHLINNCQEALNQLSLFEKSSAQDRLYQAQSLLQSIQNLSEKIQNANELVHNSIIHLEEAIGELRSYIDSIEVNPERLHFVESRLSKMHEMARKYHTSPERLFETHQQLSEQLALLQDSNNQFAILQEKSEVLKNAYMKAATKLRQSRQKTAKTLNERITQDIQKLGMPGGIFNIVVNPLDELSAYGSDEIDFLVATNPGQTLQPIAKVASGGEISRIALSIYVATAEQKTTPMIVFDEVDVGIGGGTAAIVGQLLKSLSKSVQVLCITHLPQVAAFGDQHLCVQKEVEGNQTATSIVALNKTERIEEIARMLGGLTITEKTLAHAKELISC